MLCGLMQLLDNWQLQRGLVDAVQLAAAVLADVFSTVCHAVAETTIVSCVFDRRILDSDTVRYCGTPPSAVC
jgi:hypothetical protein